MEDNTFNAVLKLYIPNYVECLEPKTRCYLHDLYKMSRCSKNVEEKRKYISIWNQIIFNIQKYFDFYQDTMEFGTEKVLIKSNQIQR